jgi:hypothetical protein
MNLDDQNKKLVVYTNSFSKSEHWLKTIWFFLDENNLVGDVIIVNGNLFREQKFHHTCVFVGDDLEDINPINQLNKIHFQP